MRRGLEHVHHPFQLRFPSLARHRQTGEIAARGHQQAGLGHRKKLGQAGGGEVAPAAHGPLTCLAEEAVRAVLDQGHAVRVAPAAHARQRTRQAEKVSHDDGARAVGCTAFQTFQPRQRIFAQRIKLRPQPREQHGGDHGRAVIGGHQHDGARRQLQRLQRPAQRGASAGGHQRCSALVHRRQVGLLGAREA